MLREALDERFQTCAKCPTGIEYPVIKLQESNFGKDRGRFLLRVAHATVQIARVPAHQDIADVEDDAIDLHHSCTPPY